MVFVITDLSSYDRFDDKNDAVDCLMELGVPRYSSFIVGGRFRLGEIQLLLAIRLPFCSVLVNLDKLRTK